MKHAGLILLLVVLTAFSGSNALLPMPVRKHAAFSFVRFNEKGQAMGYVNVNVLLTTDVKGKTVSTAEAQYMTRKRILIGTTPQYYSADSLFFYVAARQWVVDVKNTEDEMHLPESPSLWLNYPLNPQPGDSLREASFSDTRPGPNGPSTMNYRIVNRYVVAADSIILPKIGKLAAWKVSADMLAQRPDLENGRFYRYATVLEWYVPRLGVVQHVRNYASGGYYKLQLRGYKVP
ncbi:MAG: hypothetical protein IM638_14530 [Bacteroidetes bacterium]|nr:hypothetical protein [Bacteroidota bacterium]